MARAAPRAESSSGLPPLGSGLYSFIALEARQPVDAKLIVAIRERQGQILFGDHIVEIESSRERLSLPASDH